MKRAAAVAAVVLAAALPQGCNTAEGIGEDLEDAGEAIEDAAEDAGD